MKPSNFPEQNFTFGPPQGVSEEECGNLPCHKGFEEGSNWPVIISAWKPSAEELEEINKSGTVWLRIYGSGMPPVSLSGHTPWPKDTAARIAPEQVDADTNLLTALEISLSAWSAELELMQKELIDQAIIDAKSGAKSNRYVVLEKREAELKNLIAEAEQKLGRVSERMLSPGFGNSVQQIVNNLKPQ